MSTPQHSYLSTACWHAQHENKPDLHASCRNRCKFAPESVEEYCICPCHDEAGTQPAQGSWVDQARDIAAELLATIDGIGPELRVRNPDLYHRITEDPALFWLRGEVQPAGDWKPPTTTKEN